MKFSFKAESMDKLYQKRVKTQRALSPGLPRIVLVDIYCTGVIIINGPFYSQNISVLMRSYRITYLRHISSVAQSCLTLCDPMNHSTPGLPVHHKLPESTQIYVQRVGDAIQPSHSLLFPSATDPNPSQHQGLFQ